MRRLLFLALLFPLAAAAQVSSPSIIATTVAPSGGCSASLPLQEKTPDGTLYTCSSGTWAAVSGSGGATLLPLDATYTFWVSGGTTYARNNSTGAVQFSGTDAAVVINDVLSAISGTGGTLFFKNGTYSLNSVTQETVSPYVNYYAIGIPTTNAANYPQFNFVGESGYTNSNGVSGVIFNVTAAALSAAGAGNRVDAFWMRPSTYQILGAYYWNSAAYFKNISITFPDNQRGYEHAIDTLEASYLSLENVGASFVTTPTAVGATDTIAFVSNAGASDGTYFLNAIAEPGWETGFSVNTEHSIVINSVAFNDTNAATYGKFEKRDAAPIGHGGQWKHFQIYDCINGIVAGPYIIQGAELDIDGLDVEYLTSGIPWVMSSIMQTGASGSLNLIGGKINWSNFLNGVAGTLSTPFPAGQGLHYRFCQDGVCNSQQETISGTTPVSQSSLNITNNQTGQSGTINTTSANLNGNQWFFAGTAPGVDSYTVASGGTNNGGSHTFTLYDGVVSASMFWSYAPDLSHISMQMPSQGCWGWSSSSQFISATAPQTCLWQSASDTVNIGNGTPNDSSAKVNVGSLATKTYTVATLPSASTLGAGAQVVVTDGAGTPPTCTGSGSNYQIALSNGTSWSCH